MISSLQKAALPAKAVTHLEAFASSQALAARLASTGGEHWRHCPGGPVVAEDSAAVHSSCEVPLQAAAGAVVSAADTS